MLYCFSQNGNILSIKRSVLVCQEMRKHLFQSCENWMNQDWCVWTHASHSVQQKHLYQPLEITLPRTANFFLWSGLFFTSPHLTHSNRANRGAALLLHIKEVKVLSSGICFFHEQELCRPSTAVPSLLLLAEVSPADHSPGTNVEPWSSQLTPPLSAFYTPAVCLPRGITSQTWHWALPAPTLTHCSLAANALHPLLSLNTSLGRCTTRHCYLYEDYG